MCAPKSVPVLLEAAEHFLASERSGMSSGLGKLRIISRLQPGNDAQWSIIAELARMEEPELQRLLRPHSEMDFNTDQQGITDKERALPA